VFENSVLRRIFAPKRDEVTGEWRKLHKEELKHLCSSSNTIRQIKSRTDGWTGHVARMGEERTVFTVLVGNPRGKRPLERPGRRWEDVIRLDLKEIGWRVERIQLSLDRGWWRAHANMVINLRVLALWS
jgi:hypothetical protein